MARVINTANPGKLRNRARRTIAEVLRHLMFKRRIDQEAKDMAACIVYALGDIEATIEITTAAWEKRDYYLKADKFRLEWEWVGPASTQLRDIILQDRWDQLPETLAPLATRFGDIRIAKMTRPSSTWEGSYQELVNESQES